MGIIGYGRIGKATGRIASAMGMNVLAYDIYRDENAEARYVELDELFKESDVIVLHSALTEDTKFIINEESISKMKNDVLIINNSRGELIDEQALANALKNNKVAGAAVDVVSKEPITVDNPLLGLENCIITPHISWASFESRERLMNIAVNNLQEFIKGNSVNVVNT